MYSSDAYRFPEGFVVLLMGAALLITAHTPAGAQAPAQSPKPSTTRSGNADNGKRFFTNYGCYECHGREGQGSPATGPRIGPPPLPLPALIAYVRQPKGQMPPYTNKVVSDSELADIYAFLQSRPQPPPAKSIPLLND